MFQYKASQGGRQSKNLFAIYLGYNSYDDILLLEDVALPSKIKSGEWRTILNQASGIITLQIRIDKQKSTFLQSIYYQIDGKWRELPELNLKIKESYFSDWTKFENYHIGRIYDAQKVKLTTNKEKDNSVYNHLGVALFNQFFAEDT